MKINPVDAQDLLDDATKFRPPDLDEIKLSPV
jgi:hypothetical protein